MTTAIADRQADTRLEPTRIHRRQGVSAWRQIADHLEAEIARGVFGPGEQLPVEAELARVFRVNRHTVRRALAALAAHGLVRATQGRGTFVEDLPLSYAIGTRTRFSELVARAGREAGGKLLAAAKMEADARTAELLGIAKGAPVTRLDTLRLANGTPISTGSAYFPLPRFAGIAGAYRRAGSTTKALRACGVVDYVRAKTWISARPATEEETARLDLAPGRSVLTVDSVNLDIAGEPIQYTRAVFAADRTELIVDG